MVNITEDDIWNAEPALRPEDDIVLKKLHDMLQSTADDLKLLSGELSKYHEPGVQVTSLPTPLDEEFNEKVHIEELVNAKFHGYKIVDKSQSVPVNARTIKDGLINSVHTNTYKTKKVIDAGIQVNVVPKLNKPTRKNNLTVTRTKNIQINANVSSTLNDNVEIGQHQKEKTNKPTVAYKELSFKYAEPNIKLTSPKSLQVQNMPSINIRGELREQKVLQLNIEPKAISDEQNDFYKGNIAVITVQHEPIPVSKTVPATVINRVQNSIIPATIFSKERTRKFSKMTSCESSDVDSHNRFDIHSLHKIRPHKTVVKLSPKQHSQNIKNKRNVSKKESTKHTNSYLDVWKKKLNAVYGCPTSSRKSKLIKADNKAKKVETKSDTPTSGILKPTLNALNNAEYIPYSKLTLGGVRVSDIEKELSDIPNRNDITLGPILNKMLSRENSFHIESPRDDTGEESPKILTTSDENLLREVLEIKQKVTKTLTKKNIENNDTFKKVPALNNDNDQDSYVDDFEDDKSDCSARSENQNQISDFVQSDDSNLDKIQDNDYDKVSFKSGSRNENTQNKTYIKALNLSLKKNVDIFEFVHNIDTQDTGTQSNTTKKISPKETQTSPRNDRCNVQPIHNDLWPSIDPKGEVEKLFKLEKDFIKKLIVDEYGDLLEKNFNKPSTSKANDGANVTASQKNTQTSPAHVKCVMTSPARTKTRTTSPFALSLTVDQQTSPMQQDLKVNIDNVDDDLGISINLSSPRFSLRLPQTYREVISNLESHTQSKKNESINNARSMRLARKNVVSSSSSADGDYSSSDISSLGEVRCKLKKLQKLRVPTLSELSSSTSVTKYSSDISDAIVPLRSEGEVSLGVMNRRKPNKNVKSEGEASVGYLY